MGRMGHHLHSTREKLEVQEAQPFIKVRLRPSVLICWATLPSAKQLVTRHTVGDPADGIEERCIMSHARKCGK